MPESECNALFLNGSDLPASTRPLRVITQYSSASALGMQSPGRPTSLGVCLTTSQNIHEFKSGSISMKSALSQDSAGQPWTVKSVDGAEFEKLLGQLGNNGSTPVTPTSFLNPRNITEDQEIFADNFSRTLNKVKAEQEGWAHQLQRSPKTLLATDSGSVPNEFVGSYSSAIGRTVENSVSVERNQISPSTSTQLTSGPLILSSATSRSSSLSQIEPSEPISTESNHYLTAGTTTSGMSALISGLPTIFSIATGLKEACVDRGLTSTVTSDYKSSVQSSEQTSVMSSSGVDTPFNVSPGDPNRMFISSISPLGLTDAIRPQVMLRYTASASGQTSSSSNESLLASLASVSSASSVYPTSTDICSSSGVREAPSLEFLQPIGSISKAETDISPMGAGTDNSSKSSASFIGSQPPAQRLPSPAVAHSGIRSSRSPRSTSAHATSPRFQSSCNTVTVQAGPVDAVLLDSDVQIQQLTSLYPSLNGTFAFTSNNQCATGTLFQSAGSGLSLLSSLPTPTESFGEFNPIAATMNNGFEQQLNVSNMQNTNNRPPPLLLPSPTACTSADAGRLISVANPSSRRVAAPTSADDPSNYTSHLSLVPSSSIPVIPKKSRRSAVTVANKRGRGGGVSSSIQLKQGSACDSSTDNLGAVGNVIPATGVSKIGMKRARPRFSSTVDPVSQLSVSDSGKTMVSNTSMPQAFATSSQFVYMNDPDPPLIVVKSEPVQLETLDEMSNHSGSFSAGTGRTPRANTPPSSIDGMDQNHLKLERKRARNRVAARRCRERKISLIRALENQVAERDAHVRNLEDVLARYRAEGERLRNHIEMLADSYPSLKAELCQYPFLFQQVNATTTSEASRINRTSAGPLQTELPNCAISKHFS
ncbi:unnamed protein product [Calicophoron daubneyi]|uniref:BZIP domain-containing protein n=1 Tax=Calicophoron daubneyi TaxID=300641 RepID=A0AAV2TAD8_CALDB